MRTPRKLVYRLLVLVPILLVVLFIASNPNLTFRSLLERNSDEPCTERKRVAFIKVHKAASTTITSILQRFGFSRNLTFALPRRDVHHVGFLETFDPKYVMPIADKSVYDIICQHVVFNKEAFEKYLPPDITIIAAVRDPTEIFMSAFLAFREYGRSVKEFSKNQTSDQLSLMVEYLKDPAFYDPPHFKVGSLVLNRMSFDFGLPKEHYTNKDYVMKYIKMIDNSMTLVLVADRFDESLVILKRKMCWSTKDILYKIQHKGGQRKPKLPIEVQKRIMELAPSDYKLYEYFSNKFNKMSLIETNLTEEVTMFQNTLRDVSSFCDMKKKDPHLYVNATVFSEGFAFDKYDCQLLKLSEKDFVKKLVRFQVPKEKHSMFLGWKN